jgi:nitroreductase
MQINTPVAELIKQRFSCRTYKKEPINEADLKVLSDFTKANGKGPLGNTISFKIVAATKDDSQQLRGLGTYGFIQDPAGFIIGAVGNKPGSLLDFGYQMEKIILKATEINIGSCWLGGTFTKSRFAAQMDLLPNQDIPSVVSIGYPSDQRAFIDRVSRIYAGADRRMPWTELFFEGSFNYPLNQEIALDYKVPLDLVRLAPSASNRQPWRIIKDDHMWHFYLHRSRRYPPTAFKLMLNAADLQRIDLGIAMAHFELSLKELDHTGIWIFSDPGLSLPDNMTEYIISWKTN